MGRQVVTLGSWRIESDQRMGGPRVHRARDPREAAQLALRMAKDGPQAGLIAALAGLAARAVFSGSAAIP